MVRNIFSAAILACCTMPLAILAGPSPRSPATKLPKLPKAVLDDLKTMDPSEYEVFHNFGDTSGFAHLTTRDIQGLIEERQRHLKNPHLKRGSQADMLQTRCKTRACFSLTFDDGPYKYHKELEATLKKYEVLATYFVNGYNYDCIYDEPQVTNVRASLKAGHEILQHTWNHASLLTLTAAQIDQQVELLETALWHIAGIVPAIIRPPYGDINDQIVQYLNEKHNLVVITWTDDSLDSDGASVAQSLNIYRQLKHPKHVVMLNHETYASTVKQLIPQALPILLDPNQGNYTKKNFVTVSHGLQINPYKVKTNKVHKRQKTWTCDGTPVPGAD